MDEEISEEIKVRIVTCCKGHGIGQRYSEFMFEIIQIALDSYDWGRRAHQGDAESWIEAFGRGLGVQTTGNGAPAEPRKRKRGRSRARRSAGRKSRVARELLGLQEEGDAE